MISEFQTALHDPFFAGFLVLIFVAMLAIVLALHIRYDIRRVGSLEMEPRTRDPSRYDKYTDRIEYTAGRFRNHEYMTVLQVWRDEFRFHFKVPGDTAMEMLIKDSVEIYLVEHQKALLSLMEGLGDEEVMEPFMKTTTDAVRWISEIHQAIQTRLHVQLPDRWAVLFFQWISCGHSVALMMAEAIYSERDDMVTPASKLSLYLHNRKWLIITDLLKIERQPQMLNREAQGIEYKNQVVQRSREIQ